MYFHKVHDPSTIHEKKYFATLRSLNTKLNNSETEGQGSD